MNRPSGNRVKPGALFHLKGKGSVPASTPRSSSSGFTSLSLPGFHHGTVIRRRHQGYAALPAHAPQLLGGPFQLFPQTEGRLRINLPGRQRSLQLLELAAHDAARLQGEGLHSRQRLLKGLHRLRAGRSIQAVQQGKGGIRPIHLIG